MMWQKASKKQLESLEISAHRTVSHLGVHKPRDRGMVLSSHVAVLLIGSVLSIWSGPEHLEDQVLLQGQGDP